MPFRVVLDTCVLYPAHLRDTLLRLGEKRLYIARWSDDILKELERNLLLSELKPASVDYTLSEMRRAFPEAEITGYQSLVASMTCDQKDRHVLAAAVRVQASAIVTFNLKDFPREALDPYGVDVINPDRFLLDLLDLNPPTVIADIIQQAVTNKRPPNTLKELLDALTISGVPLFAEEMQRRTELRR